MRVFALIVKSEFFVVFFCIFLLPLFSWTMADRKSKVDVKKELAGVVKSDEDVSALAKLVSHDPAGYAMELHRYRKWFKEFQETMTKKKRKVAEVTQTAELNDKAMRWGNWLLWQMASIAAARGYMSTGREDLFFAVFRKLRPYWIDPETKVKDDDIRRYVEEDFKQTGFTFEDLEKRWQAAFGVNGDPENPKAVYDPPVVVLNDDGAVGGAGVGAAVDGGAAVAVGGVAAAVVDGGVAAAVAMPDAVGSGAALTLMGMGGAPAGGDRANPLDVDSSTTTDSVASGGESSVDGAED